MQFDKFNEPGFHKGVNRHASQSNAHNSKTTKPIVAQIGHYSRITIP